MGSMLRKRTGLVAVLAVVLGGVFAPSALATTPLTVSKTATAHWTRTFDWTIDKSVNKSAIELQSGSSATATYSVAVTKSAGTDAIWVDGEVCVSNAGPLPTENLTIVDRIIALLPGGARVLASTNDLDTSSNPVLDAGESHCYPYSFETGPFPGATGYENEARVTITNDAREPGTPLGPSTEAPFTFPAQPTLVNDTVNVDDTNGMSWLFSGSGSQSYNETFTCDRDKGTHVNTATIRQTGQSDSALVTVTCKEKPRDCPKGKDKDKDKHKGKGKDKDKGWGSWFSWWFDHDGYDDRSHSSSRGRDHDDNCKGHGDHDDDSDDSDSSDDSHDRDYSDDSDDRDHKGDRKKNR